MPKWVNTRGHTRLAIGICDRCSRKMPLDELMSDPNYPGLRVCKDDLDLYDPWRLAPLPPDDITLVFPRPDVDISTTVNMYPVDQLGDTSGNPLGDTGGHPLGDTGTEPDV